MSPPDFARGLVTSPAVTAAVAVELDRRLIVAGLPRDASHLLAVALSVGLTTAIVVLAGMVSL